MNFIRLEAYLGCRNKLLQHHPAESPGQHLDRKEEVRLAADLAPAIKADATAPLAEYCADKYATKCFPFGRHSALFQTISQRPVSPAR